MSQDMRLTRQTKGVSDVEWRSQDIHSTSGNGSLGMDPGEWHPFPGIHSQGCIPRDPFPGIQRPPFQMWNGCLWIKRDLLVQCLWYIRHPFPGIKTEKRGLESRPTKKWCVEWRRTKETHQRGLPKRPTYQKRPTSQKRPTYQKRPTSQEMPTCQTIPVSELKPVCGVRGYVSRAINMCP